MRSIIGHIRAPHIKTKCLTVFFIDQGAQPSVAELYTSVEISAQAIPVQTLLVHVFIPGDWGHLGTGGNRQGKKYEKQKGSHQLTHLLIS
jgi:hypothetical protein